MITSSGRYTSNIPTFRGEPNSILTNRVGILSNQIETYKEQNMKLRFNDDSSTRSVSAAPTLQRAYPDHSLSLIRDSFIARTNAQKNRIPYLTKNHISALYKPQFQETQAFNYQGQPSQRQPIYSSFQKNQEQNFSKFYLKFQKSF